MYVIIPVGATKCYGPFDTADLAEAWAKKFLAERWEEWNVMEIGKPSEQSITSLSF
jgi:hypothetical protein